MNEEQVENAAFSLLRPLGYSLQTGSDVDDAADRAEPASTQLSTRARSALRKLNPHRPHTTIDAVVASLARPPHPTLIENNRHFHSLLTDGVPVEYKDAFFQRVAAMIRKRLADDAGPTIGGGGSSDVDAAVRQVIGGAVEAGDVIDLFAAAGLDAARLDILSDDFLERVSALEQKNLALETLRKLLNDQIKISERTNLVQAQKFRAALEKAMLGYTNKQITTAEMIAQLLELAKWVREAKQHGQELGLDGEEVAFYDALAENGSAKEVMKSDTLRLMARELSEMVRKMPKLDWTQRESVRADLRRKVRRLLAMYGYPPDLSEDATQLVLKQAELSTEAGE